MLNLQDANGRRGLRQAGENKTPVLSYALNTKRNNIGTEMFQGSIDLKVFEKDANNVTRVGSINNIPCVNNPGQITDLGGGGGIYRVVWSVA